mmetsp:Transcript_41851/g.87871  ORF Transcript_41851/g.87871 Transcript_41851/m.87871 type:complete len:289 (+) Transcript_41851:3719-4585(+)
MYNRRILRMQILQPLQYLYRPPLENLPPNQLHLLHETLERPAAQYLRHEDDPLRLPIHPRSVKADDVRVMQPFQQPDLVHDPHPLGLGHSPQLHDVPRHLDPLDGVVRAIDILVGSRAELLLEANVPFGRGLFDDFGLDVGGDLLLVVVRLVVVVDGLGDVRFDGEVGGCGGGAGSLRHGAAVATGEGTFGGGGGSLRHRGRLFPRYRCRRRRSSGGCVIGNIGGGFVPGHRDRLLGRDRLLLLLLLPFFVFIFLVIIICRRGRGNNVQTGIHALHGSVLDNINGLPQ